jgi:hypothetical protein
VISEEDLMDNRALSRLGYTYAEIGRLVGRDWRTVKRYLEEGAQPVPITASGCLRSLTRSSR